MERVHINKHLVLRNRAPLPAGAILSGAAAEQEFQADSDSLHDSRDLADRRSDSLVDHVRRLLYAVEGAAEEFIGANDLQAGAIDGVVDRSIHALYLRAQDDGRGLQIVGNNLE